MIALLVTGKPNFSPNWCAADTHIDPLRPLEGNKQAASGKHHLNSVGARDTFGNADFQSGGPMLRLKDENCACQQ